MCGHPVNPHRDGRYTPKRSVSVSARLPATAGLTTVAGFSLHWDRWIACCRLVKGSSLTVLQGTVMSVRPVRLLAPSGSLGSRTGCPVGFGGVHITAPWWERASPKTQVPLAVPSSTSLLTYIVHVGCWGGGAVHGTHTWGQLSQATKRRKFLLSTETAFSGHFAC